MDRTEHNLPGGNWYAIQVRPKSEFATARILHNKGFEEFVPQYKGKRRWSDRKVELELPLFPGYIFCRFNPEIRLPIITTAGVVRIVGTGKMPLPIDQREIEAVLQIMHSRYRAEPHPFLTIGTRIRVEKGPLVGLEGIVSGYKNRQLIFSVGLVQKSIAVELDDDAIAVIPSPKVQ
ncbi:MAG: transcription termination/antitermination protein NusG [Actinomycetota bacterium]